RSSHSRPTSVPKPTSPADSASAGAVMRTSFHGELEQIETALQDEGVLVQAALRSTLEALARQDTELADRVIEADDEVDRRYLELETAVESLLARQTPVAVDLRLVLAVLFVNLHLERMADYCVTIAKLTKLTEDLGVHDDDLVDSLVEMGSRAEHMIRVAVDS